MITVGTQIKFKNDRDISTCVEIYQNNYGFKIYYFENESSPERFCFTEKEIQRNKE